MPTFTRVGCGVLRPFGCLQSVLKSSWFCRCQFSGCPQMLFVADLQVPLWYLLCLPVHRGSSVKKAQQPQPFCASHGLRFVQARTWFPGSTAVSPEHSWSPGSLAVQQGSALGSSSGWFSFAYTFLLNHCVCLLIKSLFPWVCSDLLMKLGLFFPEMGNICSHTCWPFTYSWRHDVAELLHCLFLFYCWLICFSTRALIREKINITEKILVCFKYFVSFLCWEY